MAIPLKHKTVFDFTTAALCFFHRENMDAPKDLFDGKLFELYVNLSRISPDPLDFYALRREGEPPRLSFKGQ